MEEAKKSSFKDLKYNKSHRVKPIYLELCGYDLNHKPIKRIQSPRFIGRKAIIDKIRSFIMDASSNSGAYLITGYRGMGKTSLVNKALDILNPKSNAKIYFYLWLISQFVLFDVSLVGEKSFSVTASHLDAFVLVVMVILGLLFGVAFFEIRKERFFKDNKKIFLREIFDKVFLRNVRRFRDSNFKIYRQIATGIVWGFCLALLDYFVLGEDVATSTVFYWNLGILIFVGIISEYVRKRYKKDGYLAKLRESKKGTKDYKELATLLGLFCIIPVGLLIMKYSGIWLIFGLNLLGILFFVFMDSLFWKTHNDVYEDKMSKYTKHISFYRHLVVRINLGKDKLTEKDVLKYIVEGLIKEYDMWRRRFGVSRLTNLLFPYIIFYILLMLFVNKVEYFEMTHGVFNEYEMNYFFPSQGSQISKNTFYSKIDSVKFRKLDDYLAKSFDKAPNGYKKFSGNKKIIAHLTNYLDFVFLNTYTWFRRTLLGVSRNSKIAKSFIPVVPSYLVLLCLFLIPYLLRKTNFPWMLGIVTHSKQLRDLEELNEKIHASITLDKGLNLPATKSISEKIAFFTKKQKSHFEPLDSKDIEARLLQILENGEKIPVYVAKLRFIFVFDELDKISPNSNKSLSFKEGEDLTANDIHVRSKRQETISAILAGLKNLLTTAYAKFIFIAGRDMYDAALAGVSDRESVLDSIFHDNKIYVNSFYSELDDNSINDITSMTEQFLCRYLIPSYGKYTGFEKNLSGFNRYLHLCADDKQIKKEAIPKIITTVKDFIVYVAYRSNGTPKKMTTIIEQFCMPRTKDFFKNSQNTIIVSQNMKSLHLKLSFYDQYRVSYTSYLVTPIFMELGNYMVEFGDKLLVSISYLLDHLFKFHKFGFSSRNLALTPEIVDINKEPQFRRFLNDLIVFLSSSHLRTIVSGLYEYKFDSRTNVEVGFLSRINEIESAAYNFTLDESIELKRYFYDKLSSVSKNYVEGSKEYVHVLAMYRSLLGDLHFYDQEFGEAILNYLEAVQVINTLPINELDSFLAVLLVRDNLKLGLAYEKEPKLKLAFMKYSQVADFVVKNREISIQSIGLAYFVISVKEFDDMYKNKQNKEQLKIVYQETVDDEKSITKKELQDFIFKNDTEAVIIGRPLKMLFSKDGEPVFHEYKNLAHFYDIDGEYLAKHFTELQLKVNPSLANYQLFTTENIRLLYQPLIAKLYVLEKTAPDGVVWQDIVRIVREFDFLTRPVNKDEKIIISSEFYNKLGDFMFYKNGSLFELGDSDNVESSPEFTKETSGDTYGIVAIIKDKYQKLPVDALLFYIYSLKLLMNTNIVENRKWKQQFIFEKTASADDIKNEVSALLKLFGGFKSEDNCKISSTSYSTNFMIDLANGLVDTADTLLCFMDNEKEGLKDKIVRMYDCAASYFEKTSNFRLARYCKTNVMYLAKIWKGDKLRPEYSKSIELIYKSYQHSTRPEIKKNRDILKIDFKTQTIKRNEIYPYISSMSEIREIVVLRDYIEFDKIISKENIDDPKFLHLLKKVYGDVNPYTTITTKYNRILDLNLRVDANKWLFELEKNKEKVKDIFGLEGKISDTEIKHFLIADSIGALYEVIKTHELFGTNYVSTTNGVLARVHAKMHFWCNKYQDLQEKYEKENNKESLKEINDMLRLYIGSERLYYISPKYHLGKVEEHNEKIRQMHSRGVEYMNFIKSRYYLDDDFNDYPVHFAVAVERYLWISEKQVSKGKISNSDEIFDPKNYSSSVADDA